MHVTSFHRHLLPYFIINHNLQIGLILDYLMIYNIYLSLENNLFILYQREHLNSGPHQWCLSLNHGLFIYIYIYIYIHTTICGLDLPCLSLIVDAGCL